MSVVVKTCPCRICYKYVQFQIEIAKISHCGSRSPDNAETENWFHIVVLQRTTMESTKNYDTCTQPLFCSLKKNLSICELLFATAVVFCIRSLLCCIDSDEFSWLQHTIRASTHGHGCSKT